MKNAKTAPWPADKIERWPVAKLVPYARNARTHSKAQVAEIAGAIREWGWTAPALIDERGTIIAGHGRVLAAQQLGITDIPVMIARGWTEAQKRAYTIADNQIALNAGWDLEMLRVELTDLRGQAIDLATLGFGENDLARILGRKDGLTDPDEVPELLGAPKSRPGDVWQLGPHRLACGDCTDPAIVTKLLNGGAPHLMVTDPPYGVDYDADWRNRTGDLGRSARAIGKVTNDDRADWREAWALFPGEIVYVWHAGTRAHIVAGSLIATGYDLRAQIIWGKSNIVISRGHYHPQHEPCFYAVRKGKTGHWHGDRKQSTLWEINKPLKSETGHSTQKPVECMARPIENNSAPGERVYDPFVGSGTTIIAAETTRRVCDAIEISRTYCDISVLRWQAFTGECAVRERDGRLFNDIKNRQPVKKAA